MLRTPNRGLSIQTDIDSGDETESLTLAHHREVGEASATVLELTYKGVDHVDDGEVSPTCNSTASSPPDSPDLNRIPRRVGFASVDYGDCEMEKPQNIDKDFKKFSRRLTRSVRYAEPRMSLLGKPLNYRMHRKDARVRKLQARIYNFLERPKIWESVVYHILM